MDVQVAYFSAEFAIRESLPIYSGGLGVLAGDYIKEASDMNFPLVGVGILYRRGYFVQRLFPNGTQEALYPEFNPLETKLEAVTDTYGDPILISVPIEDRDLYLQIWRLEVGCVSVYLLDADVDNNDEMDRSLTDKLYSGDGAHRICQEIILGIGGVRALRSVGVQPTVWHMNEGHAAFLVLERMREFETQGIPFQTAGEIVKSTTVFTTHTPVPAGHDAFPISLVNRYLHDFYRQWGTNPDGILELGRIGDVFNMTRLAFNMSAKVNGVSQLHAQVTKNLFHQWMPVIPDQDIAVEFITNGVHTKTWLAPELKKIYDCYLPANWETRISDISVWDKLAAVPDNKLWNAHQKQKRRMLEQLNLPFVEDTLLIGFARRFAAYKRATLLLQDKNRLSQIVNQSNKPVCFVFAGKAHPNDGAGQNLIREVVEATRMDAFRGRIVIVENYDLNMAKQLVQGVDVWLNTPVKPMEASGTSGQKAGQNGVINCSILDGWWNEGYNGKNGWAITGASVDDPNRDEQDSRALYDLLESKIVPAYYERDAAGLPINWITMMKESIRTITPQYCTTRMLMDYWGRMYLPTITRGERFLDNHYQVAKRVGDYKQFIRHTWPMVRILWMEIHDHSQFDKPAQDRIFGTVEVCVSLGPVWHRDVQVEAVGSDGHGDIWKSKLDLVVPLDNGSYLYRGSFPGSKNSWRLSNANVRVFPVSPDFIDDFELQLVTWG